MKKRLLFLCILLGVAVFAQSQNRLERAYLNNEVKKVSKYKGFVETGGIIGIGNYGNNAVSFINALVDINFPHERDEIIGTGDYGDYAFSVQTSHGYQFNPYFYLGAGTGIDIHHTKIASFDNYRSVHIHRTLLMPFFGDIRINFLNKPTTPFCDVKIGYSVILGQDTHKFHHGQGLYFNPNLGVSFMRNRRVALNAGIGYNMQMRKGRRHYYRYKGECFYEYEYENTIMGGISFKLGIEF